MMLQIIFSGLASSSKSDTQSEAQKGVHFGQASWLARSLMHYESHVGRFFHDLLPRDILLKMHFTSALAKY